MTVIEKTLSDLLPEPDRKETESFPEEDESLQNRSVTKSQLPKESESKSDDSTADGDVKIIEINGKSFKAATGTKEEKDLINLSKLAKREAGHAQWDKKFISVFLLVLLILMNLSLGSSSRESIIGISRCSVAYWLIQAVFVIICILMAWLSVSIAIKEQALKLRHDELNISNSDIRYTEKKPLAAVLGMGFVGGWVAGALGLGGGSIFNPALLTLGVPPKVSSATGLYLVTFSQVASCLVYFMNEELDLEYGFWIGLWATVGTVIGLILVEWYMRVSGRQSIIVWTLVLMFLLSVIAIPIFGGLSLKQQHEEGIDIFAFTSLCGAKK